jgi:hypothetical protein
MLSDEADTIVWSEWRSDERWIIEPWFVWPICFIIDAYARTFHAVPPVWGDNLHIL